MSEIVLRETGKREIPGSLMDISPRGFCSDQNLSLKCPIA